MSSVKLLLLAVTFVTVSARAGAQASQDKPSNQAPQHSFSILLSTNHASVPAGSKILIKFVATNTSNDIIRLPGSYHAEVLDSQENRVQLRNPPPPVSSPPKFEELSGGSNRSYALEPGQTKEWTVDIANLYKIDQPGTYSIQAWYDYSGNPWVKSNTVTVTITN